MKLIDDAHKAYRLFSVQAMALAAGIQAVWPTIPDDLKATLPPHIVHWVSIVLLIAGIAGRLVVQGDKPP